MKQQQMFQQQQYFPGLYKIGKTLKLVTEVNLD